MNAGQNNVVRRYKQRNFATFDATLWSCKLQSAVTFIPTARSNVIVTAVAVAESRKSFYLVQNVAQQNWVGNPSSTYIGTCKTYNMLLDTLRGTVAGITLPLTTME